MKILLIGNTKYIFQEWVEYYFPGDMVTVTGNFSFKSSNSGNIFSQSKIADNSDISSLLEANDFDCLVYFSNLLTYGENPGNELEIIIDLILD